MERLTILRSAGRVLATKRHTREPRGWATEGYGSAKNFRVGFSRPLESLDDLAATLEQLAGDRHAFVVRGELTDHAREELRECGPDARLQRLLHDRPGNAATIQPTRPGRRWLMLDLDGWPTPDHISPEDLARSADSRRAAVEWVREQLAAVAPEFAGVGCVAQWSASAGVKPWDQLRLHLWYWLDRPAFDASAREYMKRITEALPEGLKIDDRLGGSIQAHYTGTPVFVGAPDPLGVDRLFRLSGAPTLTLPRDVLDWHGWTLRESLAALEVDLVADARRRRAKVIDEQLGGIHPLGHGALLHESGAHPYAVAALERAAAELSEAGEGTRHQTAEKVAFSIGGLCYPDSNGVMILDPAHALAELTEAAERSGLPRAEAAQVIGECFAAGQAKPRTIPERAARSRPIEIREVQIEPLDEASSRHGCPAIPLGTSSERDLRDSRTSRPPAPCKPADDPAYLELERAHRNAASSRITYEQIAEIRSEFFASQAQECPTPYQGVFQSTRQRARFVRKPMPCRKWDCPYCAGMLRASWYLGGIEGWEEADATYVSEFKTTDEGFKTEWERVSKRIRRKKGGAIRIFVDDDRVVLLSTVQTAAKGEQIVDEHNREAVLVQELKRLINPFGKSHPVTGVGWWKKAKVTPSGELEFVGPGCRDQSEADATQAVELEGEAREVPVLVTDEHGEGLTVYINASPQERLNVLSVAISLRPTASYLSRHGLVPPDEAPDPVVEVIDDYDAWEAAGAPYGTVYA